jgi:hypothetical protein
MEGGLGFKSMEVWNKAAIAKHIWFLISGGGTINVVPMGKILLIKRKELLESQDAK